MKHAWVLAALAAASIGTSASSETVVVTEEGVAESRSIPLASLRSLEISAGRPNRCGHDALVGAVAGAGSAIFLVHLADEISHRVNEALLGASEKARPGRDVYAGRWVPRPAGPSERSSVASATARSDGIR